MAGKAWTEYENEVLILYFPHIPTQEVADMIGRTYRAVSLQAIKLGVNKTSEYMEVCLKLTTENIRNNAQSRFQKGQVPPNKGKKMIEYMSAESINKVRKTQFKKGQRPVNAPPIGTPYIVNDKTGRKYWMVARRALQSIEWESVHGVIPIGHFLVCKTEDTLNTSPDNWEIVNRAENMRRNSFRRYGPEIAKAYQAIGALNRQINKRSKQE